LTPLCFIFIPLTFFGGDASLGVGGIGADSIGPDGLGPPNIWAQGPINGLSPPNNYDDKKIKNY